MKGVNRLLSRLVVTSTLAGFFAFVIPAFVDSREYAVAVHTYATNPTRDTAAVLMREQANKERVALITHLEAAGVLFIVINVGWFFLGRRHARDSGGIPSDG
jgi:hypothetical protein